MKRFIEGADRNQSTFLPACLDDWIDESNPVRVVDAFVDGLGLKQQGFDGMVPGVTGRPSFHPSALLKLYIYGYLNRIQSSRRLEREAKRNLEVIWLVRRLTPDDKTIADFRKDNGPAIKKVDNVGHVQQSYWRAGERFRGQCSSTRADRGRWTAGSDHRLHWAVCARPAPPRERCLTCRTPKGQLTFIVSRFQRRPSHPSTRWSRSSGIAGRDQS
jgi:transposase